MVREINKLPWNMLPCVWAYHMKEQNSFWLLSFALQRFCVEVDAKTFDTWLLSVEVDKCAQQFDTLWGESQQFHCTIFDSRWIFAMEAHDPPLPSPSEKGKGHEIIWLSDGISVLELKRDSDARLPSVFHANNGKYYASLIKWTRAESMTKKKKSCGKF